MDHKKMIAGAIAVVLIIGIIIYALAQSSSPSPKFPNTPPNKPGNVPQQTQNKPSTPAPSTDNTTPPLTDTGPGDVVVLFVAASVLGYGFSIFHRLRTN